MKLPCYSLLAFLGAVQYGDLVLVLLCDLVVMSVCEERGERENMINICTLGLSKLACNLWTLFAWLINHFNILSCQWL